MPAASASDLKPCYWGHTPDPAKDGWECEDCKADLTNGGAGLKIPGHKSRWSIINGDRK